ncbi:MAG: PorP/SprF family type IX secretion system membrane protein [Bacteroidales bacterium]|nr:PorP/SprF family type IX secretion system membrane protein [Bacteroidales bacterium]
MKKLIATIALIVAAISTEAQEIYFSQYFADKLSINPAFASTQGNSCISAILRQQFPSADGGYKTYAASYMQNLGRCGIGVRAYGTTAGAFYQNQFSATYANTVTISRKIKCSAAVEAAFCAKNLKQNKLVYYSMIDPLDGSINNNQPSIEYTSPRTMAMSVGILLTSGATTAGVAMYNVAQHKISGEDGIPKTISVFAQHKIALTKSLKNSHIETSCLIPSIIYRRQSDINTIQAGVNIDNTPVIGGIAYRIQTGEYTFHTLVATIGTTIGKVRVGYGHDFDLSSITKNSYGAHEIAVTFKLSDGKKNKGYETIKCPAF